VAGGLEPQRTNLLRLEPLERLGRPRDHVEAQQPLLGRRQVTCLAPVEIDVVGTHDLQARRAHRHRLVLDHRVEPAGGGLRVERRRAAHEDLHRALVGVLRVVGAQRVLAGEP
jgi:hypothetical protein